MAITIERSVATEYVSKLKPNPLNPRGPVDPATVEELAASIAEQGILQPLLIAPDRTVVAGHRRLAAAKLAGLDVVPVMVRDLNAAEQLTVMLVENLQRQDLTPLQEARAYKRLVDAGKRQADIARATGVTTSRIQLRLKLLNLDPAVQQMLDRQDVPLLLAPVLCKVGDPMVQRRLAVLASRKRLTVDELEKLIGQHQGTLNAPPRPPLKAVPRPISPEPDEDELEADGSRVTMREAVALLTAQANRTISLRELAKLLDDTCSVCGMSSLEEICRECPCPELAKRVAAQ